MKKIAIGERLVGEKEKCLIIAEAGVNHNGDVNLAKQLIDEAAKAGADAIKFQTFHAENVVTRYAEKADYQRYASSSDESHYDMLGNLELPDEVFEHLSTYAKNKGIIFLSSPFDEDSVDLLDQIDIPAFKIPSGEIANFPLLKKIAEKNKPIILSTGMATLGEVESALQYLKKCGAKDFVLLHCTTSYPASIDSVNLCAMETLRCAFQVPVGYSDHTEGITISIAALALGACILEKHFTLDRALPGPDHKASLEPQEMRAMVKAIRDVEGARGDGKKGPTQEEEAMKLIARRSIVARCELQAGDVLDRSNLAIKRPGTGIEPKYFESIVNRKVKNHIKTDQVIKWDMIE